MSAQLRRFWTNATVAPHTEGFVVALDGKPALTPARGSLATRHRRLAEAVAAEWAHAPEVVDPRAMPLTGYLNAVIDRIRPHAPALAGDVAKFAAHEHICYRAEAPGELVRRQAEAWDPVLEWLKSRYDVALSVAPGVMYVPQPADCLARLAAAVAALDPYRLAAGVKASGVLKSLALTLAMLEGRMTAADAYAASRIDEIFQVEHWGMDAEATRRVAQEAAELDVAARFLALLD